MRVMNRTLLRHAGLPIFLTLALALLAPYAVRAQSCSEPVATIVSVQGTIEVKQAKQTAWQPVKRNDAYCPGDTLRAQEHSRADISLRNQSVLRLNANTTITLEAVKEKRTSLVSLLKGAAHFFSRGPSSLEVNTPFTVAGVRGTEFYISVDDDKTLLTIFVLASLSDL